MVSTHSKKELISRVLNYWIEESIWQIEGKFYTDIEKINEFLIQEYKSIPDVERIGKGRFFIAKTVTQGIIPLIEEYSEERLLFIIKKMFNFAEKENKLYLKYFSLVLAGECATFSMTLMQNILNLAQTWLNHPDWEIRETSIYILRKSMQVHTGEVLSLLESWSISSSPNLRRAIAEGLRPLEDNKWLRDPTKNDQILEILARLSTDPSVHVRKSVGNNLKDLTRYMPEKILILASTWIMNYNIQVVDDLASKSKKELGETQYYLIWTLKHAFRWIQQRNPEFHEQLTQVLGKNYVMYFNEKRNRLARPPLL
ncbi:DNA alkylation repair protein [Candidatus Hodarchaeum mangrovi]